VSGLRSRAAAVLAMLAATLALAAVLIVAFEPDIQRIDADELVSRSADARAFLGADFVFILLYAVLSPIAIWRFGTALGPGTPPLWMKLTALLLVGAGLVDATENTLLLSATGSVSESSVDVAHALAIPKVTLFTAGAVLAIVANIRAAKVLRES
jgi:hypothetical protein